MYDDDTIDDDVDYLDREDPLANEKLERIGGAFVEPDRIENDCNTEGGCAPDDYPEDPYSVDVRPGTPDDVGYGYGLESTDANDITFVPDGGTHQTGMPAPDTERDEDLGQAEADDLWERQEPLIEEDVDDGLKLPAGMDDEDGERILGAMGDDSGDETADAIGNTSATGEPTTAPEHGGFPDKKE